MPDQSAISQTAAAAQLLELSDDALRATAGALRRNLWEPLCLAAINIPAERAERVEVPLPAPRTVDGSPGPRASG